MSAGASGSARGMMEEVEVEVEGSADEEEEDEVDEAAEGEADEKEVGTAGGVLVIVVVAWPASEEDEASDRVPLGFVL